MASRGRWLFHKHVQSHLIRVRTCDCGVKHRLVLSLQRDLICQTSSSMELRFACSNTLSRTDELQILINVTSSDISDMNIYHEQMSIWSWRPYSIYHINFYFNFGDSAS